MARFDIHTVRGGLALDCQADQLRRMPTRFVVPIEPLDPSLSIDDRLNPHFLVRGQSMIMVTQLAGTIRTRDLGDMVARLESDAEQLAVQRAIDLLTTGV